MSSESKGGQGLAHTLALPLRPFGAALFGSAEPRPADRPWPAWLRWTRRYWIGRFPFPVVVQLTDLVIAVIILFSTYTLLVTEVGKQPGRMVDTTSIALTSSLMALALALRERHPVTAWRLIYVTLAWTESYHWMLHLAFPPGGSIAGLLILYTLAVRSSRELTLGALMLSVIGVLWVDDQNGAGAAVVLAVPLLVGFTVRQRQISRRQLAEQEEAARQELAEQERRHRDAEAVLTERQRIARELHDVVAHHMSMIAIQAEAAPYKVSDVPAETRRDLAEIRATALDALTEMRRILGVLRSEDAMATAPQPGLDRIDELVAGARSTGLDVRIRRSGDLTGVPQGVGLTAYRIAQEALSNAMRHAPMSKVDIDIVRSDGILLLEVVNGPPGDGHRPTPSPPGEGHGLVGMRERVAMLGGTLAAEPTPGGGFAVSATLPEAGGT